ncbi:MAG: ribose 5-phosphate isomerase B [Proteobacteria bacterium]|nr:MAG: ribose 5-phosphate isomerase B [Pseudomonadota bacterium]
MPLPTIAIAADHAGFALKEILVRELGPLANFTDCGPYNTERVDYPDFAAKACAEITGGRAELAILICGSGLGMSIAANKINGIRAAHSESTFTAQLAREHNDANVLCLGERVTGPGLAVAMARAWLTATFETRHQNRIDKVHALEQK